MYVCDVSVVPQGTRGRGERPHPPASWGDSPCTDLQSQTGGTASSGPLPPGIPGLQTPVPHGDASKASRLAEGEMGSGG